LGFQRQKGKRKELPGFRSDRRAMSKLGSELERRLSGVAEGEGNLCSEAVAERLLGAVGDSLCL